MIMPPIEANSAASTKIVSLARQTSMPRKLARVGVVADHAQGVAERRLRDLAHQQQADHQQRAARE